MSDAATFPMGDIAKLRGPELLGKRRVAQECGPVLSISRIGGS